MTWEIGWLALAGAAGTLSRYYLGGFVQRLCGSSFPFGTLSVNALGCLLFGFVWVLAEDRLVISNETRFIVLTGFMGAFTTFSTFAFETTAQMRDAEWMMVALNLLAQLGLGFMFVFLGMALGRLL